MYPMAGTTGLTIIVVQLVVWLEWSTLERHVIWRRVCSSCIWCLKQELPFLKSRYVVYLYSVHFSNCIWLSINPLFIKQSFKYLLRVTPGVLFNKNNKASMKYICRSITRLAIIVAFEKLKRRPPSPPPPLLPLNSTIYLTYSVMYYFLFKAHWKQEIGHVFERNAENVLFPNGKCIRKRMHL